MLTEITLTERRSLEPAGVSVCLAGPAFAAALPGRCDPQYPTLAQPRYKTLDAWRGFACLMVVVLHASFAYKVSDSALQRQQHPIAWAVLDSIGKFSAGVPLFFVISGYCVSATTDSSRRRSRGAADYFTRRVRRIVPPYWIALLVTIALYAVVLRLFPAARAVTGDWQAGRVPSLRAFSSAQWLGNWTLSEQWRGPLFGHLPVLLLPPTWTLCYEEQFYAVCGLLLVLMPSRFFLGALIVSALTAGTYALALATPRVRLDGMFLDGRWLMFAVGVLVYYNLNYQKGLGRWLSGALLVLGVGGATLLYKRPDLLGANDNARDIAYSIRISGVYALLLMVLRPLDQRTANARILAPLVVCGRMCYSLYLIHWPVSKLIQSGLYHAGVRGLVPTLTITMPLVVSASLLAGWGFHLLVERRFINSRRIVNAC